MKPVFQWVVLYLLVFLVMGYIVYTNLDHSDPAAGPPSVNETVGIVENIFGTMYQGIRDSISSLTKKQLIDKKTLLNLAPKQCSMEDTFVCHQFTIDANRTGFVLDLIYSGSGPIQIQDANLTDGIECNTSVNSNLHSGDHFYLKFYDCKVYQRSATVMVTYTRTDISDIRHITRGVISLGYG